MDVGRPLSTAEPCRRLSWRSHDTMIAPSKLGRAGRSLGWGTGSQKTRLQSSRTNATPAFRAADGEGKGTDSTTSYGRLQRPRLWLFIFAGSADVPPAYRLKHSTLLQPMSCRHTSPPPVYGPVAIRVGTKKRPGLPHGGPGPGEYKKLSCYCF